MKTSLKPFLTAGLLLWAPSAVAARRDCLDAPFVADDSYNLLDQTGKAYPRWDFPGRRRTRQYRNFSLPQAPVLHPEALDQHLRESRLGPKFTYNLQLPGDYFEALPASIQARVASWGPGFRRENLDILCVIQDLPWRDQAELLFSPLGWTTPEAPDTGSFHKEHAIEVGLLEAQPRIRFRGHADAFFGAKVSVRNLDAPPQAVVSRPGDLYLDGLDGGKSEAFWTLTREGARAVAALQVVLGDEDQAVLERLAPKLNTLRALATGLGRSPELGGKPWVERIRQLTRPLIAATQVTEAPGADYATLVITGSGLADASSVQVGGKDALSLRVDDDSQLTVKIRRGPFDRRDLRIATPLGSTTPGGPAPATVETRQPSAQRLQGEAKALSTPGLAPTQTPGQETKAPAQGALVPALTAFEFSYPADGKDRYAQGVDAYFKQHPQPPPNIQRLIQKHLEWARTHYGTHLADSKVTIYRVPPVAAPELLALDLTLDLQPAPEVLQEQDHTLGPIRYHLKGGAYRYQSGHAFTNFANKLIGGGVFEGGFVQEEIALLESSLLPWVAAVRNGPAKGVSFCPDVSLLDLDTQPVVIKARRFLEMTRQGEIYGGRIYGVKNFDPGAYLKPLARPMDIYLPSMAAKFFGPTRTREHYLQTDIADMTLCASRAFFATMLAQHCDGQPLAIHTGNWGTGAFGNSRRAIWAMQRLAVNAAYGLFCRTTGGSPRLDFHYDAYDADGVRSANEACNALYGHFPVQLTLGEGIRLIFERTQEDPAWRPVAMAKAGR